jgi:hypothetical protein
MSALGLVLRLDPSYVSAAVFDAVRTALVDGLFASGVLALSEPLYRSRIEEVVTDVPGVLATHGLKMLWLRNGLHFSSGPRFSPGDGGFFTLTPTHVFLSDEVQVDD